VLLELTFAKTSQSQRAAQLSVENAAHYTIQLLKKETKPVVFAKVNSSSTLTFWKETQHMSKETYSQKRRTTCKRDLKPFRFCEGQFEQHADFLKRGATYVKRDL